MLPPVEIRLQPGLIPVLKHGNHNQKDHAGKGRTRAASQIVNDEIKVGDLRAYLPGSEEEMQQTLDAVSEDFARWGTNYNVRVASHTIMGLEGEIKPRGVGDVTDSINEGTERILRNPSESVISAEPILVTQNAQVVFSETALLMDASTTPLPEGTRLYRGVRLLSDDPRLSASAGDDFEIPLSAFATEKDTPERFARGMTLAPGDSQSVGLRTSVIFTVETGARGHVTQSLGYMQGDEVVAQGRFRVKDRTVRDGMVEISLEQVAYYDIREGAWSDG
jgi:hypothetical protein